MTDARAELDRGMDLIDMVRVLLRQWVVLLVGAVLTVGTGLAAVQFVPATYQASGQLLLLLKPEASGESTPTNPYLNLDANLTTMASLIASTLSTKAAQEELAEAGFDAEVSVALRPGTGPLVSVSTAHGDPGVALRTRDEVIDRMQQVLEDLQDEANAPDRQRIESRTISTPETAVRLSGNKLRALAVVAALGIMITLTFVMVRDKGQRNRGPKTLSPRAAGDGPDTPRHGGATALTRRSAS